MFLKKYKCAFDVLRKKPVRLWGLSLMLALLTAVGTAVTYTIPFLSLAVMFLFVCSGTKLYMDGLKGKNVNSKQLFAGFSRNSIGIVCKMAWMALWSLIWICVPVYGIMKIYSYRFVPYIAMTNPEVDAFDALKLSMKMTKGKKRQMFLADLLYIAVPWTIMFILGLLALIPFIGGFFAMNAFIVEVILALFGNIFVGLYQAAFYDESEVAKFYAELKAEEAEANAVAAN